jgi:hypothetical protein
MINGKGGPVAYQLKEGMIITDDWLFENVVPNIRTRYRHDNQFCQCMMLCLLWASFDMVAVEGL